MKTVIIETNHEQKIFQIKSSEVYAAKHAI
jgi:hypothetical protein